MRLAILIVLSAAANAAAVNAAVSADLHVKVLDTAEQPVADAVVYATPVNPASHLGPHQASIDQVHRQFVPRVSVVQVGTAVTFPNSDNIRHSVYSFSHARTFTLKLYAGTPASPVVFDQPGVVVLGCNIHDSMVAWVLVVDTPYVTRTAADGTAALAGLPPGDYRLRTWDTSMPEEQAGEALHVGLEAPGPRQLHVEAQPVTGQP
jgi:plastocyanin